MASRRDQLQSYQFVVQRSLSALVMRETDPAQSPLRRGIGAAFGGAMIAIIIAAVFAVVGLITKTGSGKWQVEGAVVVEKETGAPFVYRDSTLYPMANFASALLASGQSTPKSFRESRNSLSHTKRGNLLGIPNAPNSMPSAGKLLKAPWTICTVPSVDQAGHVTVSTSLILGHSMGGSRIGDDQAMLVRDRDVIYLIWHSHRYEISGANTVTSLFGAQTQPVPVASAWLNGLPIGSPIAPIDVSGRGGDSQVAGHKIGDLLVAQTGTQPQYYLVLSDGLAAITELQQAVYAGAVGASATEIRVFDANNAKKSDQLPNAGGDAQPPAHAPKLVTPGRTDASCAEFQGARTSPNISTVGIRPELTAGVQTIESMNTGATLATRISVDAGRAALVRALPSATASSGAYNLVTDLGIRYPITDEQALRSLGYTTDRAVDMPANLVNRIPPGPTLDPGAALLPVVNQTR